MARQEVYALGSTPVQLNTADRELGETGQGLQIINIGDDAAHWRLASASPDGPGFRIDPLATAYISLPTVGLWAWSSRNTRLMVLPGSGSGDADVKATAEQTLGSTPVALAWPAGLVEGATALVRNVGPRPALRYWGADTPDPATVDAVPIPPGGEFHATETGPDGAGSFFLWTDRHAGTALLVQHLAAAWWSI